MYVVSYRELICFLLLLGLASASILRHSLAEKMYALGGLRTCLLGAGSCFAFLTSLFSLSWSCTGIKALSGVKLWSLVQQETGFGFRIVGGTEGGSQVGSMVRRQSSIALGSR
jgi:hypothetical protein